MLTARENVEVPLLLTDLSSEQRRERSTTALQLVDLEQRSRHRPSQLSGGQQQRVAIARAIVVDADILICDEPTGDLDRRSADDVLGLLRALNDRQRKTILMVTHDPKATGFASRTVHIDKGTLLNGKAAEL